MTRLCNVIMLSLEEVFSIPPGTEHGEATNHQPRRTRDRDPG